jgi:hypothetical protein
VGGAMVRLSKLLGQAEGFPCRGKKTRRQVLHFHNVTDVPPSQGCLMPASAAGPRDTKIAVIKRVRVIPSVQKISPETNTSGNLDSPVHLALISFL